ncbi:ATP synthase F0 subunit B [Malonomonas rubra]|uniref:ATP synthase F0 subunit B n=1 Tax=Malonomonas rubra TaxID=57040 RepID=UPI0026F039F8|nr:ATP synthase F0 subunit B [Malonomonas rubra]
MIEINWTVLLQAANFIILMAILNVLLYRPLRKVLSDRRATIDGAHERARGLEGQIEEKMARYEEKLQAAKLKGSQEKASLRQAAATEEAGIIGNARDEATQKLQAVKGEVADAAASASQKLKSDAQGLAAAIATKIMGRAI